MKQSTSLLSFLKPFQIKDLDSKITTLLSLKSHFENWNQKHNLFSKNDLERFEERHLLDSLTPLHFINHKMEKGLLVDIGSGTGFPSIPLSIILDNFQITGIEPREKRVFLLNQFRRTLGLKNIKFIAQSAEQHKNQNHYHYATARAVGSLEEDWRRAQPLLQKNGQFITFKTRKETLAEEVPTQHFEYQFPSFPDPYYLVSVKKSEHGENTIGM